MKRIIAILALFISGYCGYAQRIGNRTDPGLSASNYKHPNKAAYARLHNVDGWTSLSIRSVARSENYKQPATKKPAATAVIGTTFSDRERRSYKHPHGL